MCTDRHRVAVLAVVGLGFLAGCGGVLGAVDAGQSTPTPTVTPAPVPGTTPTSSPLPSPSAHASGNLETGTVAARTAPGTSAVARPRYASVRPTCERPPGAVVSIQIAALRNNDVATNDGVYTAWRFTAPSTRRGVGSYSDFLNAVLGQYRPLLEATTVSYGPLEVGDGVATRGVTVRTDAGTNASYRWRLARQSDGRFDGCWMTTAIRVRSGNFPLSVYHDDVTFVTNGTAVTG